MHVVQELQKVPGIEDLANALLAYTQRHLARMDRLLRSSYLLDYTLDRLNVLSPLEVNLNYSASYAPLLHDVH